MDKRGIGLVLIVLSILTTIWNISITGAVIGSLASSSLSILTILLFVIGIVLFFYDKAYIRKVKKDLESKGVSIERQSEVEDHIRGAYSRLKKDKRAKIYNEVADGGMKIQTFILQYLPYVGCIIVLLSTIIMYAKTQSGGPL